MGGLNSKMATSRDVIESTAVNTVTSFMMNANTDHYPMKAFMIKFMRLEWLNKYINFYFANEGIDRDMSYKKCTLKELRQIKFDKENN